LLAGDAHAQLAVAAGGWQAKALGEVRFKGIGRPVHVFQLVVDGQHADFPPLRLDRLPPPVPPGGFGRSVRGYELREQVGRGDFGIVYRAYQPSLGAEWQSGSSARSSSIGRRSFAGSRPRRDWLRSSSPRTSSRSTTTGAIPRVPTSSCGGCAVDRFGRRSSGDRSISRRRRNLSPRLRALSPTRTARASSIAISSPRTSSSTRRETR